MTPILLRRAHVIDLPDLPTHLTHLTYLTYPTHPPHSARSAVVGSTRVARHAGT